MTFDGEVYYQNKKLKVWLQAIDAGEQQYFVQVLGHEQMTSFTLTKGVSNYWCISPPAKDWTAHLEPQLNRLMRNYILEHLSANQQDSLW